VGFAGTHKQYQSPRICAPSLRRQGNANTLRTDSAQTYGDAPRWPTSHAEGRALPMGPVPIAPATAPANTRRGDGPFGGLLNARRENPCAVVPRTTSRR
jgi:hypothetical protein